MQRLRMIMQIQAIVIGIYGVAFVLLPGFATDTIFGWAGVDLTWVRAAGVPLIALALVEWLVVGDVEHHLDRVWPFVGLPVLYALVFLFERAAGDYQGPDSFWWTNLVVVVVFAAAVAWARLTVGSESPASAA